MGELCSFPGCGRKRTRKDLCIGHRRQMLRCEELRPIQRHEAQIGKPCSFPACGRPSVALRLCAPHYKQHRRGDALLAVGDRSRANQRKRDAWARLSDQDKVERLAGLRAFGTYERTEEWSRRMSQARQTTWANGEGRPKGERHCRGCEAPFMPASARQRWCSETCYRRNRQALSHGLSLKEFEALRTEQGYGCAICCKVGPLNVDHDHETGRVRGLLCVTCNTALGKFGDSAQMVAKALAYLSA